jgi:hypothetical protein
MNSLKVSYIRPIELLLRQGHWRADPGNASDRESERSEEL